ncbi:MAG: Dabb family protein [Chitinophagaceae bacterium]|jgi:hypothetical protein|nr:Dabb family protein [Chitinophagaceae bacterium]
MLDFFSRRQFVETVLAGTGLAPQVRPAAFLVHHVFFWLQQPASEEHKAQLIEGLKALAAIPQVQRLLVGTAAGTEQRGVVDHSYQVSELMYFRSLEDQAAYQEHPIHKAFVEKYSHLWQRVVVYDTWMTEQA